MVHLIYLPCACDGIGRHARFRCCHLSDELLWVVYWLVFNSGFRPAGVQHHLPFLLAVMGYLLLGLVHDCFSDFKEEMPVKIKVRQLGSRGLRSICNSLWALAANLLASALLA